MTNINIHEAKTTLSKLVAAVEGGGGDITLCRAGKAVARITPLPAAPRKIISGLLKGQIWLADDFDKTDTNEAALFGIQVQP